MKTFNSIKALALASALLLSTTFCLAQELPGHWKGVLSVGNDTLALIINVTGTEGKFAATLDVPQQGVTDIAIDKFDVNGPAISLSVTQFGMSYEGSLVMGNILGTFSQNGMKLPLTFAKVKKTAPDRPQNPKEPYPYRSEEVSFTNSGDNVTLSGTLTLPEGSGPFPAVVLVSGSGTQDRDEELMGHKPFLVTADFFTRRGIAVLRYDDRGYDSTTVEAAKSATSVDLSYDAEAAAAYLMDRPEIDKSKVGVAGHSEGGMIVFMIAARRPDIAFALSFAGPAISGRKVIQSQQEAILKLQGAPEEYLKNFRISSDAMFDLIDASPSSTPQLHDEIASMQRAQGVPEAAAEQAADQMTGAWMFYFVKHDPAADIESTNCPALVLNGSKDMQVIAELNIPAYNKIIADGGKTNITVKEMPGLNHLFQHCRTGNPSEYYSIAETISPEVLELASEWILNVTK